MTNDTILNLGSGGDSIRDYDDGTRKWPVGFIAFGDVSGMPIATPTVVSSTSPLPVTAVVTGTASTTIAGPLGQKTMASSIPVVIASNQATFPVTATIASPLGQVTMASSIPVVIASNQSTVNVAATNMEVALAASTAPSKMLVVGSQHNTTIPTPTAGQTLALQSDLAGGVLVNTAIRVPTYTQAFAAGTAQFAATVGDAFTIFGSGTKTVKVLRLSVLGLTTSTTATSAAAQLVAIAIRSTADTGGTILQTGNGTPHDQSDATGTATVRQYSANPTTGTLIAYARQVEMLVTRSVDTPDRIIFNFNQDGGKPITLRGTGQGLTVYFNNVALIPDSVYEAEFTWTEDDS